MKKLKKPISILLALMMIVSLFAVVPFTASAETMPWPSSNTITTGGEYTCPSTLSQYTTVSGGTEENPVIINITGSTTVNYPICLLSGYLKIVGNNNTVEDNRGFVFFTGSGSYKPKGDAHLTITDLSLSSTNASNQYIQILSYANFQCQSTFENVTFKNCNINGSGAVVIGSETTHTFKNCTFEDITGYNAGGISFRYGSDVTMEGCTFKNCTRTRPYSTSFLGGGAVWLQRDTKLTLDGCTFENCTGECGAIGIESDASLTLKGNTTITGNSSGNLYLPTGATFKISDDFTGTVGVTTQTAPTDSASVTLASGLADTQAALANKNIVSDNANYAVRYDSNKLFLVVPATYTVTWKNGDTELETDENVAEGTTPTYDGEAPTKASDKYYDYTFSGWTPAVAPVTEDVTYTAQFTATAKTFKAYVKKLTGGTYTIENLTGETTVTQLKEIIAVQTDIPATAQRLIFAGKQLEDAKTLAEYNIEKESTIHLIIRGYTVTWLNYDNSELGTKTVQYGATPSYDGETPTKPEDENNTYTFAGWSPEITAVTGNATYTAQFTAVPKSAPVKLILNVGENGKVVMDNGTFGNATDASNISYIPAPVNVADGYKVFIVDGHSANLVEGGSINIATGGEVSFYPSADNTGKITAIPDEGYICTGWYNGDTRYTIKDTIDYQEISEDMTLTAKFAPKLFPQHSVSLGGDIGVNFYINPAAAGADEHAAVSVLFSWNGQTRTVKAFYDGDKGLFKATCDVVAAEIACDITAVATINNETQAETDTYSVQTYAEKVYADPAVYDNKGKPEQLKALAKALLNYGAMAQTVFVDYMKEPVKDPAAIVSTVGKTNFDLVSADDIAGKINGTASDLNAIAAQLGFKYYTSSVLYLQNNTLRLYFTPNTYQGEMPHAVDFKDKKSNYYYYVEKEKIAAAELDNQQTFTIGGKEFTFSALDYAKAVVNSGMDGDQKDLAKSLYLYNQAANAYFD